MLYTNYYIIDADQLSGAAIKADYGIMALNASSANLQKIYTIACSLQPAICFCLCFNSNTLTDSKTVESIIAFFFLPNYHKIQGIPVILMMNQSRQECLAFTTALMRDLKYQGFDGINTHYTGNNDGYDVRIYNDNQTDEISEAYKNLLQGAVEAEKKLYIKANQLAGIENIHVLLENEEHKFSELNRVVFSLLEKRKQLEEEFYQMTLLLKSSEQELANQQSHNAILRSNSHATELQYYYNNEYEALPGWYKKVGQLIKVLSGKRSFRSLFNKNIKKYKD